MSFTGPIVEEAAVAWLCGLSWSRSTRPGERESVSGSRDVIVSLSEPITWSVSLDPIVIGERLATALSGVYMPFRRSPS